MRNCQTETPIARAATSSWLRVRRWKLNITPNRTGERQKLLQEERQVQPGHGENDVKGCIRSAAGAPQKFDQIDHDGDRAECQERDHHADERVLAI